MQCFPSLQHILHCGCILTQCFLLQRNRFFQNGDWDKTQVETWLKVTNEACDWLLVCMHLTYGQPARGSELCSLLYSNSSHGQRHLFWARGTLMLATQYDKSRSLTQRNKLIARFFPKRLAQLMKLYLLYIRPMEWYSIKQLTYFVQYIVQ